MWLDLFHSLQKTDNHHSMGLLIPKCWKFLCIGTEEDKLRVSSRKKCTVLLMLVALTFLYLLRYVYSSVNSPDILYNSHFNISKSDYVILWYAKPSWMPFKSARIGNDCYFNNCVVIQDVNRLNISDVVLFHHKQMNIRPPVKRLDQIWVFVSFESPLNTFKFFNEPKWNNKFDWTYSYRKDSEVSTPYKKIVPVETHVFKNYTEIFLNKTKNVAWVVSNCKTASKRELYVDKMKKVIDVDIFGKCGKPCKAGDCFKEIAKNYKFYLSFENSLCEDYVTEKLFRLYSEKYDIVPVVRGAPNIKELVPTDTFIPTIDFASPKDLANYLKNVGKNITLYTRYLYRKHRFRPVGGLYDIGMCEVCKNLNKHIQGIHNRNIWEWISKKSCKTPSDI